MNFEESRVLFFVKRNLLIVILVLAGLICFGYGLISLSSHEDTNNEITIGEVESDVVKIKADIEGAVIRPGVYELSGDSRIEDLIVAAGGLSSDANREYITKNINLAQKITDASKVYIPREGEKAVLSSSSTESGLININTGSKAELDKLPGIGEVTAEKIINNRPYQSLEELVSKKIITSKVFEDIKDKVSL
jgi:competence protein ComEA